jgi:hypothetical protein
MKEEAPANQQDSDRKVDGILQKPVSVSEQAFPIVDNRPVCHAL